MLFARPTVILIFDRLADELYFIAPVWADDAVTADVDAAIAKALDRIDAAPRVCLRGCLRTLRRLTCRNR